MIGIKHVHTNSHTYTHTGYLPKLHLKPDVWNRGKNMRAHTSNLYDERRQTAGEQLAQTHTDVTILCSHHVSPHLHTFVTSAI